ncbi:copper homeostasis membrane protein CopD [Bradyrhizobium sp. ISRA443]|uniref:copper homeostasis membrane protein CopD n=1 Tax=unclassified Bradyrhizobium TaxID=2631580 RepID=UPI00247945DD|nr:MULTISPECIES: copper homeostasis membrane protein CopD [unclassified Bradyrhizobium]WGR95192.1 copper homeostasis membrane protein CopD [Bradyrhizobium sp. ISRA435]WGS00114.1 copper homeostasis membrane protein CopD [Bradyrhizobium sp. ISRA436]WGS07003.1 copper homeostasis membrane protein CopD [Bradyrhizobium sp. ISRA437]WGS13885.1 copper homeostasis membrane protein CopD [Bradyrhizobium sp. ISRA443]
MMVDAGLACSRFVHFACAIILFGGALFALYSPVFGSGSARLARMLSRVLLAAALGALLSGLAWFLFTVGNMSGTLAGALDAEAIWSVLRETGFGRLWVARIVLMLVVVAMAWPGVSLLRRHLLILLTALAAILLSSLAGVGHTQIHEGALGIVHVTADAVHLLAAGAWLGGLLPLGVVVASCRMRQLAHDSTIVVLSRFSGMGYCAVAALLASGSINGWFLVGSFSALVGTSYGELLQMKLGAFGLMLCLAASNRFWLVPALAKAPPAGRPDLVLARLRRNIVAEQILGALVIGIVSVLGTLSPAVQGS